MAGIDDLPKDRRDTSLPRPAAVTITGDIAGLVASFVINAFAIGSAGVAVRAIIFAIAIALFAIGIVLIQLADADEPRNPALRPGAGRIASVLAFAILASGREELACHGAAMTIRADVVPITGRLLTRRIAGLLALVARVLLHWVLLRWTALIGAVNAVFLICRGSTCGRAGQAGVVIVLGGKALERRPARARDKAVAIDRASSLRLDAASATS